MFDVQAHRGGAGLAPENTMRAFENALAVGVSTLECDVHISLDGVAMVCHDRLLDPDTVKGPYAGELIPRLTRAQLAEVEYGGAPMPALADVLELLSTRHADEVELNVETKFDVIHPDESGPRDRFVEVLVETLRDADMCERASVQCFDWRVLHDINELEPRLSLNVLVNASYLEEHEPGKSPWMDGLDIDEFYGSIPQAVAAAGFDALSPSRTILTPTMVAEAHEAGLRVLPYTVDDPAAMRRWVAVGVDGLITNRPDLLREVLESVEQPLPRRYPAHG